MKTSLHTLSLTPIAPIPTPPLQLHPPASPRLEWIDRRGTVLHPCPLSTTGDVLGLNLARGCAYRCAFCSVRAYPNYPGDGVVQVYRDTADHLAAELDGGQHPRAVFLSPSTDPFPPLPEVQAETGRVVEVLARRGVEAWLLTRGTIRPAVLRTLSRYRQWVKVTVALTSLDAELQQLLEPATASPQARLRQIARLREQGIAVQVALDPLIPGLTDTRANLTDLLTALAAVGIRHVSAGYLFLRPGIQENLLAALAGRGWQERVLEAFQGGPMLASGGVALARYLPKTRRQRGYAALMALAAAHEITVAVSGTSNPDFATGRTVEPPRGRGPLLAAFLNGGATARQP